jgi:hypothetical protein
MYKYHFIFKKANKSTRWLYNDKTNRWKKARTIRYSERFLDSFTKTVFSLMFVVFCLYMMFANLPFTGIFKAFSKGETMPFLIWVFYFMSILSINRAVKSNVLFFMIGSFISALMLVFSDMLMEKYNTVILNYIIYGVALCLLYILLIRLIKRLINRKTNPEKIPKKKLNIRSF